MIICAGNGEEFGFATSIGVGLVNSAIGLTKLLSTDSNLPKEIIFIGSFGLYKNGQIFDIIHSENAVNLEISAILDKSYSPIFSNVSRETNLINSSNFITTDSDIASKFANLGFIGENMELYSVLKVAKNFKIPAYGILCATNFCDQNAHDDFIKNHAKAKEKLEIYLKSKGLI